MNKEEQNLDNALNQKIVISDDLSSLTSNEKLIVMKKLREETGWGLMDCRRALCETKWDYDNAKGWLIQFRKKSGILFD
jgi:hypothetical protein